MVILHGELKNYGLRTCRVGQALFSGSIVLSDHTELLKLQPTKRVTPLVG